MAAELQQIEIVELLLQHGAMYNVTDLEGSSPLDVLTSRHPNSLNENGEKIVWLLNALDSMFNDENLSIRLRSAFYNSYPPDNPYRNDNFLKNFETYNPIIFMINAQDNQKNSLVHLATNRNDKQALTLLLKANHDYLAEKQFVLFF